MLVLNDTAVVDKRKDRGLVDLVDLFPLLHVLDLFPDRSEFRRGCLNVGRLREEL